MPRSWVPVKYLTSHGPIPEPGDAAHASHHTGKSVLDRNPPNEPNHVITVRNDVWYGAFSHVGQMRPMRKYGKGRVRMTEKMKKLQEKNGFNPLLGCLDARADLGVHWSIQPYGY